MCKMERIEKDDCPSSTAGTEYRNNAQKVLKLRIDMEASAEDFRNQIEEIVGTLCPFLLRDGEDCPIRIKPLTGGLTNHLFLVSFGDTTETNTVLVRIHPDNEGEEEDGFSIVDRDFETKFAAWLASQQEDLPHNRGSMAPAMYGRFENGRVEEFYPNVRPLAWAEMKTYATQIAQSMASFHTLEPPPEEILRRPPTADGTSSATIYQTIPAWLEKAKSAQLDDTTSEFLDKLSREWDWLATTLAKPPQQIKGSDNPVDTEALEFIRRMTITHMDCQPLNILISNEENPSSLRFIDYEYCGWNPIAADIANTFCEYCEFTNLCADCDKEYPSPAQQDEFFWYYLLQSNPARAKQFSSYSWRQDGEGKSDCIATSNSDSCDSEWELFSATLQQEVGRFSLLSHLGWSVWSMVKAQEDDGIDFDYKVYARHRMDGYAWAKKKFCAAADDA